MIARIYIFRCMKQVVSAIRGNASYMDNSTTWWFVQPAVRSCRVRILYARASIRLSAYLRYWIEISVCLLFLS